MRNGGTRPQRNRTSATAPRGSSCSRTSRDVCPCSRHHLYGVRDLHDSPPCVFGLVLVLDNLVRADEPRGLYGVVRRVVRSDTDLRHRRVVLADASADGAAHRVVTHRRVLGEDIADQA